MWLSLNFYILAKSDLVLASSVIHVHVKDGSNHLLLAQLNGYNDATFRGGVQEATYLSHHVVAHGVLLRGGQQGSLRGSLGLWRLRWAGQKATAGLGGHWRRANIGADEGQAW